MKRLEWNPTPEILVAIVKTEGDLWFSSRCLAIVFGVSKQNISIHIGDLQQSGMNIMRRVITVAQNEGGRVVSRQITHYPFAIAHAIALRAQRYSVLNLLTDLAGTECLQKSFYKIAPIKERDFAELLIGILDGIQKVVPQFQVGHYIADFYLPDVNVVVEYDESHHEKPSHMARDLARQRIITNMLGSDFVRVKAGAEAKGLNEILRRILVSARG